MDDPADVVLYRVERAIAVLTLSRPGQLNAWTNCSPAALAAIKGQLQRADSQAGAPSRTRPMPSAWPSARWT